MLEKQQQQILIRERKQKRLVRCIAYATGIYLLFLAVFLIGHFYFEIWNPSVVFAEFIIATAIVICISIKIMGKEE
ncbi:hypothetical protein [Faecalicatena faecalis]|nr:hypothetical protein [Faecalicatena faecalis]